METDKRRLEYNDQVRGAWQVVQCWAMAESGKHMLHRQRRLLTTRRPCGVAC